jgi:colanic acid/amylovoran biosynthesis glycosyltransferase
MVQNLEDSRERVSAPVASADIAAGPTVAYFINQYPKVSHSFIRREILALERRGFTVRRIALRGWDDVLVDPVDIAERPRTQYILKDGLLPLAGAACRVALRRPKAFLRALSAAVRMSFRSTKSLPYHLVYLAHACRTLEFLGDEPVTHMHAHFGTNSTDVAMLLHLLGGPPYSFTAHGANETDDGKYLHLGRKVHNAKFAVAVSSYTRAQVLRHVEPEDWDKVHVVHCGLDRESFADEQTEDATSDPIFLCIGRLSSEKGHSILLDAFSKVAARHPDAKLVLAGDGPLREMIENRILELGLMARVRITGWISSSTVRDEILGARVVVQPSLQEGLPVVLMEAMAVRRPVISTYVAGIPELVIPGEVGWLVPAANTDALVKAMEESLALSPDALHRMGRAAQKRARERHSIDSEAAKLAALIAKTA